MPNHKPEIGSPEEWLRHAQSDLDEAIRVAEQVVHWAAILLKQGTSS